MKFLFLLLLPLFAHASVDFYPWQGISDPNIMSRDLERNFRKLPLKGAVAGSKKFWSGDYWALKKGSINFRWKSRRPIGFNLRSPTKEQAERMTLAELSHLSPAEKYDLFLGRYDYPLKEKVDQVADPGAQLWEGLCHGWAPATMNHQEPYAKGARNPDGIQVPFGSADIKALLSWYYANGFTSPTHQMGRRCYGETRDPECREDLNAGAFHIVMVNKVALRGEGIIIDLKHGKEVWNHPIRSFETKVLSTGGPVSTSAPEAIRRVKLETKARVINGTGNYWETVLGTNLQKEETQKYSYWIELDAKDNIVGGEWDSENRPDFLWVKYQGNFSGEWGKLKLLLND